MNNTFRVYKFNDNQFHGEYKNHEINISRDESEFYILVMNLGIGGYAYDGGWGDGDEHIADALQEAIRGSKLNEI